MTASTRGSTIQYGIFIEIQKVTSESVGAAVIGLSDRNTLTDVFGNTLIEFEIPSGKKSVSARRRGRRKQLIGRRANSNSTIGKGTKPTTDNSEGIIRRVRRSN